MKQVYECSSWRVASVSSTGAPGFDSVLSRPVLQATAFHLKFYCFDLWLLDAADSGSAKCQINWLPNVDKDLFVCLYLEYDPKYSLFLFQLLRLQTKFTMG